MIEEIIDPEVLRQFHIKIDAQILVDYLMTLDPDNETAEKFIDVLCGLQYGCHEEVKQQYEATFLSGLDHYHQIKYGVKASDNINLAMLMDFNSSRKALKQEFDYNGIPAIPDTIYIKRWKNVFNTAATEEEKNVTIGGLCIKPACYTEQELLENGYMGKKYKDASEIDLTLTEQGYLGYRYQEVTCQVQSNINEKYKTK